MACTSVNTEDIEFCEGDHSEGGFSSQNFFSKVGNILSFPKLLSDPTLTPAENTSAALLYPDLGLFSNGEKTKCFAGNIVFKTGFNFSKFPALSDSGSLTGSLVKEGSTNSKNEYSFEY